MTRIPFRKTTILGSKSGLAMAAAALASLAAPSSFSAPADLDLAFQARFGDGLNIPWIQQLTVEPDGRLLVFGNISSDTIPPNPGLARLKLDGSVDAGFQPGLKGSAVTSVITLRSGKILVAGRFSITSGGESRTNLARLEQDGSLDPGFDAGQVPTSVSFLARELAAGKLLAAGSFTDYQRSGRSGLVRLHADGQLDAEFPTLPYPSVRVESMVPGDNGTTTVMGLFFGTSTEFPVRMTRLLADGTEDPSFRHPNLQIDQVSAAAGPEGTLYVTSPISTESNGHVVIGLVRLLRSGEPDPTFSARVEGTAVVIQPGNGLANPPQIRNINRQPDGRLLIAGKFVRVNGVFRRNIARLEANGALDPPFDPGTGPINTLDGSDFGYALTSMAVAPQGRIYLIGAFNAYNRRAVSGLIRLVGDPIPRFENTQFSGGRLNTTWIDTPGNVVEFETSTNLTHWTPWQTITNEAASTVLSRPATGIGFLRARSTAQTPSASAGAPR